jgi:hypothetical protein
MSGYSSGLILPYRLKKDKTRRTQRAQSQPVNKGKVVIKSVAIPWSMYKYHMSLQQNCHCEAVITETIFLTLKNSKLHTNVYQLYPPGDVPCKHREVVLRSQNSLNFP